MKQITTKITLLIALAFLLPVVAMAQLPAAKVAMPTIAVLKFSVDKQALLIYWQERHERTKDRDLGTVVTHGQGEVAVIPAEYRAMTDLLTDGLINTLVASHKFRVVTRDRIKQVVDEQKFMITTQMSPDQAVKTGKILGADYLVSGSISLLQTRVRNEKVPYTGETDKQRYGMLMANIQVIDAHTGQIVAAYPVKVMASQNLNQQQNAFKPDNEILKTNAYFMQTLKDKASKIAANKVLLTVFPLNIIKTAGKTVYINRGIGANFKVGDVLTVYKKGSRLTDPTTGQFLGFTESAIGTVKVEAIEAKFAKASIVTGKADQMQGSIVKVTAQKPADTGPGGGLADTPGSSAKPLEW